MSFSGDENTQRARAGVSGFAVMWSGGGVTTCSGLPPHATTTASKNRRRMRRDYHTSVRDGSHVPGDVNEECGERDDGREGKRVICKFQQSAFHDAPDVSKRGAMSKR